MSNGLEYTDAHDEGIAIGINNSAEIYFADFDYGAEKPVELKTYQVPWHHIMLVLGVIAGIGCNYEITDDCIKAVARNEEYFLKPYLSSGIRQLVESNCSGDRYYENDKDLYRLARKCISVLKAGRPDVMLTMVREFIIDHEFRSKISYSNGLRWDSHRKTINSLDVEKMLQDIMEQTTEESIEYFEKLLYPKKIAVDTIMGYERSK